MDENIKIQRSFQGIVTPVKGDGPKKLMVTFLLPVTVRMPNSDEVCYEEANLPGHFEVPKENCSVSGTWCIAGNGVPLVTSIRMLDHN